MKSWLALSASLEYLCYGSTTIRNILILSVRGQSLYVIIWHLQTSDYDYKDGPRTERVIRWLITEWLSRPFNIYILKPRASNSLFGVESCFISHLKCCHPSHQSSGFNRQQIYILHEPRFRQYFFSNQCYGANSRKICLWRHLIWMGVCRTCAVTSQLPKPTCM